MGYLVPQSLDTIQTPLRGINWINKVEGGGDIDDVTQSF